MIREFSDSYGMALLLACAYLPMCSKPSGPLCDLPGTDCLPLLGVFSATKTEWVR
jgi:hypothetical protein